MKVLFTCVGGMTSSLLAAKLKKSFESDGYSVYCQGIISESDIAKVANSETDHTISYMHIMGLTMENRKREANVFDKILIAPQAEYLLSKVIDAADDDSITNKIVIIEGKANRNIDINEIKRMMA